MSARPAALALLVLLVGCASAPFPRRVATAPEFPAPGTEAELDRRLAFLEERLDAGRLHAAGWSWGWLGFQTTSGAWEISNAVRADHAEDRAASIVNAVKSGVGVADILVIRPMPGRSGAAPVRGAAGATRDEKLARLARGESELVAVAARARQRRSWGVHLASVLFNAAGSAVLLGLGHGQAAWLTFATGVAGGEAQIWSEPWRGTRDLAAYEKLVAARGLALREPDPSWHGVYTGGGFAVELRY